jgi:predicted transcriptional regulator
MMKRIKIEPCATISEVEPTETEKLKRALRVSQREGLIQPTGDPSLDAPLSQEDQDEKNPSNAP